MLDCPIVGVALDDWDDEALRKHAREAVDATVDDPDDEALDAMLARLSYVQGDYGDDATFDRVEEGARRRQAAGLLPRDPALALRHRGQGARQGGPGRPRPRGDREALRPRPRIGPGAERRTREVLDEEQILRIDHYLGKEPVMDISYLRFANSMLEPVWNREHISHVQMTIAEDFGVDDRGRFYDSVGAMRDVIQNHALQVLGLIGMEPPTGNDPDSIRDKKLDFFKAMRAADPKRYVRGQYDGFLDVKDVDPNSTTETFAAIELEVDNWRWSGVPFFIRAGKFLPEKTSEVTAVFRRPPLLGIGHGKTPEPNHLTFRIEPEPGARMRLFAKAATTEGFEPADLEVLFERKPGCDPEPYERLLGDALNGVHTLFTRQDAVEETWRVVQPLLDDPGPIHSYERGTWGPRGGDRPGARYDGLGRSLAERLERPSGSSFAPQ